MAKSKKVPTKPKGNSTLPSATKKPKPKKSLVSSISAPGPDCCAICATAAAGTMIVCEDGVMTAIPPPAVPSVWTYDPNRPGGLPYWEAI